MAPAFPSDEPTVELGGATGANAAASAAAAKSRFGWRRPSKRVVILCGLAGVAVIMEAMGFATLAYIFKSHKTAAAITVKPAQSAARDASPQPTGSPVSEATVAPAAKAAYTVPADQPRYLRVAKLGINSRVLTVTMGANGELGTPSNIYDTGWYTSSSKPGTAGAMLIVGHMTGQRNLGVFTNLSQLVAGDTLTVQRGDGAVFNYRVVHIRTYPLSNVDMASALVPITPGKPGLNLITCSGTYLAAQQTYSDRLIVYAEQI
jgi:LPXTG-site transpeptidase (sortase) family protein